MKLKPFALAATLAALGATSFATPTLAQEQFIPLLSYRTGAYAPNGVPWAIPLGKPAYASRSAFSVP